MPCPRLSLRTGAPEFQIRYGATGLKCNRTQGNGRGNALKSVDGMWTDCIQLKCEVVTSFFCISNASQSDRTKSKLSRPTVKLRDYKNDWPWDWGPMTKAAGPTVTNRGPAPSLQFTHL